MSEDFDRRVALGRIAAAFLSKLPTLQAPKKRARQAIRINFRRATVRRFTP